MPKIVHYKKLDKDILLSLLRDAEKLDEPSIFSHFSNDTFKVPEVTLWIRLN